jgi:hypothetical protein
MHPNVGLNTLSRYKRKLLGESISSRVGKQSKISTQTQNYIAKNPQNVSLNGLKCVQSYLLTLGVEKSYQQEKAHCLGQKTPALYCK